MQVSLILSGFAALSFVASAGTDPVHRATFVDPALAEVREGLVVRERYLALRRAGATTPAPGMSPEDESDPDVPDPHPNRTTPPTLRP